MFSCIKGKERTFRNLINGEWINSSSDKFIDIYSPVGNCLVGKVPAGVLIKVLSVVTSAVKLVPPIARKWLGMQVLVQT